MEFSEKLLYHIWDAQHIIKKPVTVSGKQVIIMYQGQWNTDFGADFRNGIVNIDGEVLKGNIELHLRSYDWTAHKHNEDSNFNSTVLHVVYEHNGNIPYTITEDGKRIEILELKNQLDQDIAKLIKKFDSAGVNCPDICLFFAGLENSITDLLLTKIGIARMEKKIRRYAAELFFSDFNQLLYQGIMEAGGYSKNNQSMLQIAIKYPYVDLLKWKDEGMTLEQMQSILILGSGLGDHIPSSIAPEQVQRWHSAYEEQQFIKTRVNPKWNLFRVRPVNHPVIRILQTANMISKSFLKDLLTLFTEIFNGSLKDIKKEVPALFNEGMVPEKFLMGSDRVDIIMINVILPVMILYADKTNNQKLREKGWVMLREYGGLSPNHIESFMKQKYMNEPQKHLVNRKAVNQQGLLKLFYDYCRYHNCSLCQTHKKDLILNM